jgi:2-keto-3-deoxy-L-rhamnonate aldolase RhmA
MSVPSQIIYKSDKISIIQQSLSPGTKQIITKFHMENNQARETVKKNRYPTALGVGWGTEAVLAAIKVQYGTWETV